MERARTSHPDALQGTMRRRAAPNGPQQASMKGSYFVFVCGGGAPVRAEAGAVFAKPSATSQLK
jgi:hypothetical protein